MMREKEGFTHCLEELMEECRFRGSLLHEDERVVEVELLLLAAEVAALERTAHRHGQTVGQMIRQIVRNFLTLSMD